jgi:hypothetical protein
MARTKEPFVVPDENRDHGKTFILTEMPGEQGELWAIQAACLIEKAGMATRPEDKEGMAGLAQLERRHGHTIEFLRAIQDPSLEAMWQYVQFDPGGGLPPQPLFKGDACQIEEIQTRLQIRMAFLRMHLGFFSRGKARTSPGSETKTA